LIIYLDLVDIEALANAANEAVVQLPFPAERGERRVFNRVYTLAPRSPTRPALRSTAETR
jgi:hypothetical protein